MNSVVDFHVLQIITKQDLNTDYIYIYDHVNQPHRIHIHDRLLLQRLLICSTFKSRFNYVSHSLLSIMLHYESS